MKNMHIHNNGGGGGRRLPLESSVAPRQRIQKAALCIGYRPLGPQQPPQRGVEGGEWGTIGGAEKDEGLAPTLPDCDKKLVRNEWT